MMIPMPPTENLRRDPKTVRMGQGLTTMRMETVMEVMKVETTGMMAKMAEMRTILKDRMEVDEREDSDTGDDDLDDGEEGDSGGNSSENKPEGHGEYIESGGGSGDNDGDGKEGTGKGDGNEDSDKENGGEEDGSKEANGKDGNSNGSDENDGNEDSGKDGSGKEEGSKEANGKDGNSDGSDGKDNGSGDSQEKGPETDSDGHKNGENGESSEKNVNDNDGKDGQENGGSGDGEGGEEKEGPENGEGSTPSSLSSTTLGVIKSNNTYFEDSVTQLLQKYGISWDTTGMALETQVLDRLTDVLQSLDPDQRVKYGYQLKELLIQCSYDSMPCDYEKDFSSIWDPDFGNCYTFNHDGHYKIEKGGTAYGLRMIALSNVSEYLPTTAQAGMRITVHNQSVIPFPNTDGFNVAVGTHTTISVQYVEPERLPFPYGDCHGAYSGADSYYKGDYTYEGCFRACFQRKMIATCGCADGRFPKPPDTNASYCGPGNMNYLECYKDYVINQGDYNSVDNCTCSTGCREADYRLSVSYSKWPSKEPYQTTNCHDKYPKTNIDCYTAYTENAILIEVSFSTLAYEKQVETPNMSGMDLFQKIAGAVCLWLGISLCCLGEVVELLSYICLSKGFHSKGPAVNPYDSNDRDFIAPVMASPPSIPNFYDGSSAPVYVPHHLDAPSATPTSPTLCSD
ncbi:hypothetical protein QR680_002069 [Steinernema hermaphroditum]|uniref:Amiloride-sensitive sodium channel n=1 Tax=Steinernema hermaphroditum TaxID=289476 RepID=A0AA39LHI4_9BILA|nr:hypothetical protein QR680_002069 [Steinernema hermaphroditum]